jgi:RimJ/RimL family protein N-acetyltransferase
MNARSRRSLRLPVTTARLSIRELAAADEAALIALYADPRVTRHLLHGPDDEDGARRHLARVLRRQQEAGRDTWELAVEAAGSGQLIGACDLTLHPAAEAEIGYLLAPACWGQGLGTELAVALVRTAFEQLRAVRVLSTVEVHNARSLKVLDKAGLRWEGTLRRYARARRRWWDVHLYAVTRDDWQLAER